MEQIFSWQAITSSSNEEIQWILCEQKVHYRIPNSPPHATVIRHISTVHALPSYLFKIHFNNILPSTSRSSNCQISFRFFTKTLNVVFYSVPHVLHTPTFSLLGTLISKTLPLPINQQSNYSSVYLSLYNLG